ncbi:LLM class flavin-dependent oxidoreductase [Streptomyces sp. SID10815]|uniref:LLM class flavin-dependent oxidoreductase n=1 Tax=Streptomyces sp. SID10815 TaxID=2706027 RepID=UPI0013CBDC33|nr:LLM class flavin-dependent oxidoreductase [Streptomyces sp. SID10815]NEA48139.1 LLM class flavin-dependent oxidoreductase [Streptomyces sp. SID10815]
MSLRLSTLILPYLRWHEGGRSTWTRAEELGFHAGYTYDHLSWRTFRDGPWFGAVPTLTAAAAATGRMRLGTMVTSPNFRHPVTLAKELISLDDVSGGRITLGIGAGGTGFDATVLGQEPWSPRERADRLAEFVPLLDRLLTEDSVSSEGDFYSAHEARNLPGCVQRPRLPFAVAATGPRGLRLTARYGQAWVTTGDPSLFESGTPEQSVAALRGQIDKLGAACAELGRDVAEVDKILLTGFTPDRQRPLESVEAFVDFAGRHRDLGFTEIVLHWPIPDSDFAADEKVFEKIATEAPGLLA